MRFLRSALIFVCICMMFGFVTSDAVYAQRPDRFGLSYGQNSGLGTRDVRDTVASLIRVALGFLGVLFLLIILYGVVSAAAGGTEGAGERARKIIFAGVVGLIIIFVGYALTSFVFNVLISST